MNVIRKYFLGLTSLLSFVIGASEPPQTLLVYNPDSGRQHGLEFVRGESYNLFADQQKREQLRRELLEDPRGFLERGEQAREALGDPRDIPWGADLLQQQTQENPLWLIRECTNPWCPLKRAYLDERIPDARDWVERFIVSGIESRHPNKQQPIRVSFFGAGDMLSELIIITRLLERGYQNLSVNLIGGLPDEYRETLLQLGGAVPLELDDPNEQKKKWLNRNTYRLAQVVQWLHTYPANVHVSIYEDVAKYLEDCKSNPAFASDVCVGIDIRQSETEVMDLWALANFYQMSLGNALKVGGVAYTCSRSALLSCRSLLSAPLQERIAKKANSLVRLGTGMFPPIEVLEKVQQPSEAEAQAIEQRIEEEHEKDRMFGVVYILDYLLRDTRQYISATRHQHYAIKRMGKLFAGIGVGALELLWVPVILYIAP